MKGLHCSDNVVPRSCGQTPPRLLSRVGSSRPSYLARATPEDGEWRRRARAWAGGFLGIPRPALQAPPPARQPRLPPPPPAGVALPPASGSGGGGESSGGRSLFSAAAGWIVSIKVFFSSLARSLALLRDTGGGVHPQPPSERATHTQGTKAAARGLLRSSPSGPGEEGASVRPGPLSRASAPPRPPRSRPGSSEGISGPPARLGGPGAMLTRGLGNA